MSYWQENYGFVKEVYEYRMTKYKDWMDNLEKIVIKVLARDTQYSFNEFKMIQDTLDVLCRDMNKEDMKEWLDQMLEIVSIRSQDDNVSSRDKEFKSKERRRLQELIIRHEDLKIKTKEMEQKVDIYSKCYSFGDDIHTTMRTLEEMLRESSKEVFPYDMKMVKESIEKMDKVRTTVKRCEPAYERFMKIGQDMVKTPNCAPFLAPLMEKLTITWKDANEKSTERYTWLTKLHESMIKLATKHS